MSKYNDFFDGVSPLTSDREFAESIAAKSRRRRGRMGRRRIFMPPAAALSAAAVLTVSVSAAYNMDLRSIAEAFFGDRGNNITEESIVSCAAENAENTFENLYISVKGAVRDGNFTVIFLDAAITDGGVFDRTPYTVTDEKGEEIKDANGSSITEEPVFDFVSASNKVTFREPDHVYSKPVPMRVYSVKSENNTDANAVIAVCLEDTKGSRLRLDLSGLYLKKCHGSYAGDSIIYRSYKTFEAAGNFSCEIDLGDCNTKSLTVLNAGEVDLPVLAPEGGGNEKFSVDELTLSCTSLSVKLSCAAPKSAFATQLDGFAVLVMRDGREIAAGDYRLPSIVKDIGGWQIISETEQTPFHKIEAAFILPETIDIDDADYVLIGGKKIYME